jgi:hypothetical protein
VDQVVVDQVAAGPLDLQDTSTVEPELPAKVIPEGAEYIITVLHHTTVVVVVVALAQQVIIEE